MSSVFAKKYRNRTRWAHNVSKMVGYLLVGCSIFLLVLLFMLMHTNPNPVPALIIISAFVLLCFFYAYVIVLPDDLTLTATDRTLQTASQLLTFASQGLSPEMATGVCSIILPETFASAIAVTDGSLMLATAGKNADKYPMGHPVNQATLDSVKTGQTQIFYRDEVPSNDMFPLRAGIVVPLKVHNEVVGTIELYYTRAGQIDQRQIALSTGFGELLSSQLVSYELEQQFKRSSQIELRALQSQVDPHFLFNTIGTIVSVVRTDPGRARTLLIDLSNYYRQTLGDAESLIPLSREFEQGMRYITLMQARYGEDRLCITTSLDPDTVDMLVPPFILQPILENCVKHGMREIEPLHIGFSSKSIDDGVEITVVDDGVGMPPEVLASAFDSNARTEQPLQKGCGLALCNVMSRVRYFFDFRSGIDIQSTLGEGTTVRFKLVGAPRRSKTAE
ncbi:signal transduction histidine kinase, LytS [Atopobium minutum]|uniref:Two-component system, LytT family, sensor histidine kinase LytS n=1 Tax=Atopobium minutum TaxID=1381 RepID=A0AB38A6Y7_9ACTN|nr:histidine kinase [Atopobium minutum]KRN55802.1 signal transduction histidine kinase, LytS [Atopobium minutum]SEB77278.1 two-component system, LytT family, sensor histidine kinase LytS [Atopobium minutum]